MKRRECFKDWIKENLEEEVKGLHFSREMKERVRQRIVSSQKRGSWWDKRIPMPVFSLVACSLILVFFLGVYTRTFLFVSQYDVAGYRARQEIIVNRQDVPFGAVQLAYTDIDNER